MLDAGHVVEFDTPLNLLREKNGFLRRLVDASEDKNNLLELARLTPF